MSEPAFGTQAERAQQRSGERYVNLYMEKLEKRGEHFNTYTKNARQKARMYRREMRMGKV